VIPIMSPTHYDVEAAWFATGADPTAIEQSGLKIAGGGGHQSKTLMLEELGIVLAAVERLGVVGALTAVTTENLLGKTSVAAAGSALVNLNKLYAIKSKPMIFRALARLWATDLASRPMLALLCALGRDPLLRNSAPVVLRTTLGEPLRWPAIAAEIERRHPDRFSTAMLKSLSQNCASSWTQSGHLGGRVSKKRTRAEATPEAATFAALLAQSAGFGGLALLSSPWMEVLDAPEEERLGLLRRAQGRGLVRVRHAGAVFELKTSPELVADLA
jgi:hypothetical protein